MGSREVSFRPLTEGDLPLLARWQSRPHVARWWHDASDLESITARYSRRIREYWYVIAQKSWWTRIATGVVVAGLAFGVTSCGSARSLSTGHQGATSGVHPAGSTPGPNPGAGSVTVPGGKASTSEAPTVAAASGTVVTSPPTSADATATTTFHRPGPTSTTTMAPSPPPGSGVYGYVTAGPTCPVEQASHPCPPEAVSAELDARDAAGTDVGSTRSDSSGRYALALPAGSYSLLVVTGSGGPRCPDTPVTVASGRAARADIACDTGIR
jgi:hypothetical protein